MTEVLGKREKDRRKKSNTFKWMERQRDATQGCQRLTGCVQIISLNFLNADYIWSFCFFSLCEMSEFKLRIHAEQFLKKEELFHVIWRSSPPDHSSNTWLLKPYICKAENYAKLLYFETPRPLKWIDKCQTQRKAALPIRLKFFLYLGHNMWNNFNRWAAECSPGEQKLVSLSLSLTVTPVPFLCLKGFHHWWFDEGKIQAHVTQLHTVRTVRTIANKVWPSGSETISVNYRD